MGGSPLFLEKSIELGCETREPVLIVGDTDRLTQVFTNIIGNAITYTQPGGEVAVIVEQHGAMARAAVTDNGKGVAADDLERIFDRFQRVDPNLTGGTGVGLTAARSLIHRHGGEITVSSKGPGTGSRFVVSLSVGRLTRTIHSLVRIPGSSEPGRRRRLTPGDIS